MKASATMQDDYDVAIVSYASFDVGQQALLSAVASQPAPESLIVVENHPDAAAFQAWADFLTGMARAPGQEVPAFGRAQVLLTFAVDRTRVLLLHSDANGGYAGGNELARQNTASAQLLVLNPDCVLLPGGAAALLSASTSDIAAVSGVLLRPCATNASSGRDTAQEVDAFGGEVSMRTGRPIVTGRGQPSTDFLQDLRPQTAGRSAKSLRTFAGACVLLRREALNQVGGFPEQYFLYYDEAHLTMEFLKRGWRVFLVPASVAEHSRHYSTRSSGATAQTHVEAYHGARSAVLFARSMGKSFAFRWFLARLVKAALLIRSNPQAARATASGAWDGLRAA